MTPDEKLPRIVGLLKGAGIDVLVMGGHAVRYYGIDRNTVDFDVVTSLSTPDELRLRLPQIAALGLVREEPVWRSADFARYEIGRLPDGREEWLEFWLRNHLLASFSLLKARAEVGLYGGQAVPFLSMPDLMRSKETERESDWQDIALLEEIQDARHHAAIASGPNALHRLLSSLRSRRGMDRAIEGGLLDDRDAVAKAAAACGHLCLPAAVRWRCRTGASVHGARGPGSAIRRGPGLRKAFRAYRNLPTGLQAARNRSRTLGRNPAEVAVF